MTSPIKLGLSVSGNLLYLPNLFPLLSMATTGYKLMTDIKLKHFQFLILLIIFLFSSTISNAQSTKTNADSGWVQITTNLDEFYVVINEDFYNPVLLNNNEYLLLASGKNQLRLVWNTINDWQTQVTVIPAIP